jgi:hypothetical protein
MAAANVRFVPLRGAAQRFGEINNRAHRRRQAGAVACRRNYYYSSGDLH